MVIWILNKWNSLTLQQPFPKSSQKLHDTQKLRKCHKIKQRTTDTPELYKWRSIYSPRPCSYGQQFFLSTLSSSANRRAKKYLWNFCSFIVTIVIGRRICGLFYVIRRRVLWLTRRKQSREGLRIEINSGNI